MMTLEAIVQEIQTLPVEERKQLVMAILDSLTEDRSVRTHSVVEFRGAGVHLRDMDAQEYVDRLRREWDEHP